MRLRHAMPMLLAALLLGACHGKDEAAQAGGSTPQAALQASLDLFRAGDFDRLWKQALPDCTLQIVAGGGHFLDLEAPERLAELATGAATAAAGRE